ncbi:hypothetical protein [Micromonospora sp. NPDC050200]|uniref:hypothetical protein n=1 Tax=Micromonospora sp. NPDC050200 TaxID=3155664 RepID=UPI0033F59840
MSEDLRTALRELGEQMPAARLSGDLWAGGRRLRRRERRRTAVAALVAVLACVGLPAGLLRVDPAVQPAAAPERVPSRVGLPYMWQASVAQDPPGRASLLLGGGGLGLSGIDGPDDEGKVAVVGRNGVYRMMLYGAVQTTAGEEAQLSPDGRYVADGIKKHWLTLTDLTDGRERAYRGLPDSHCCATPSAWSRDGTSMVVIEDGYLPTRFIDGNGYDETRLVLLDLTTGATRVLLDGLGNRWSLRTASVAAFAPDGSAVAATAGDRLSLLDREGRPRWSRDLGPRRKLAGSGAFTPDGTRIAVVDLDGCLHTCDAAARDARTWRVTWLDVATGRDVTGPTLAPVRGQALRALGWRHGTDLVALRYEAEPGAAMIGDWNDTGYWETGHVQLVALRPDGETETLLDPPREVWSMDVARDLLEAGRFGGPPVRARPFPARPVILLAVVPPALLLAVAVGLVVLWRRHRRWRRTLRAGPGGSGFPADPPWPSPPWRAEPADGAEPASGTADGAEPGNRPPPH